MKVVREHKVITELIEMYRNLPCLWDVTSNFYKDTNYKALAWRKLVTKLKEIEPEANVDSVKKKIFNMRSSYKREFKKVTGTKKTSKGGEVHVPHLWFYKLLSFLDEKDAQCRCGIDTTSDEESQQSVRSSTSAETSRSKRKGKQSDCVLEIERKKAKLKDTAQELRDTRSKSNSFGVYVGEELEKLNTFQRQIAEKLISEVLFLGKTENLDLNSKIETPTGCGPSRLSSQTPSSQHISPSAQLIRSSTTPRLGLESQLPKLLLPRRSVSTEDPLRLSINDNYKWSDDNSTSLLKELLIQK